MPEMGSKGIEGRLIRYAILFVLFTGLAVFLVSRIELEWLKNRVGTEDLEQADIVKEKTSESLADVTEEGLQQMVVWAADKTDDEFWIMEHDLNVLAGQTEDVLANPEHYERLLVEPPRMENKGKLALQLLLPEGIDSPTPEMLDKAERLANLAPMMEEMLRGNEGYTLDCYISTPDGMSLVMDSLSDQKFDENGEVKSYDARVRPWYQGAVDSQDKMYFSSAIHSNFYDFDEVVFSIPVYVDGELAAVVEGSASLEIIQKILRERNIGEEGFSILVNGEGQLVYSPRQDGELAMVEDSTADITESVNTDLANVIKDAIKGGTKVTKASVDDKQYYVAFAPLPTAGWTELEFVSTQEIMAPTQELLEEMDVSADEITTAHRVDFGRTLIIMLVVLSGILILATLMIRIIAKRQIVPLQSMTKKVQSFTDNDMNFDMEEIYHTGDEIEVLAQSFEAMSKKIKDHVDEIVQMKTKQERIDAELSMATQIQEAMLPRQFPAFPERKEFELYADMVPAKNVGGDFYDFFFTDDDHLALVMADVSGKGITAALFMAQTMQTLRAEMLTCGNDIQKAITEANKKLCTNSVKDMFVTIWLGLVTISTGKMIFVNSGHEYAAINSGGTGFTIEKDNHSMPAAALKSARFKINEMTLKPGDILYLYTDGVAEAHNTDGEMFGLDRLCRGLNEAINMNPEALDGHIRKGINDFAGDAEQYDDITTLCFKYIGE